MKEAREEDCNLLMNVGLRVRVDGSSREEELRRRMMVRIGAAADAVELQHRPLLLKN